MWELISIISFHWSPTWFSHPLAVSILAIQNFILAISCKIQPSYLLLNQSLSFCICPIFTDDLRVSFPMVSNGFQWWSQKIIPNDVRGRAPHRLVSDPPAVLRSSHINSTEVIIMLIYLYSIFFSSEIIVTNHKKTQLSWSYSISKLFVQVLYFWLKVRVRACVYLCVCVCGGVTHLLGKKVKLCVR